MDIYQKRSSLKIWLTIIGIGIVVASFVYTNDLAGKLADEERKRAEELKEAYRSLELETIDLSNIQSQNEEEQTPVQKILDCDTKLASDIISGNTSIPLILENDAGVIEIWRNFPNKYDKDTLYFRSQIQKIINDGGTPLKINFGVGEYKLWYTNSANLRRLRFFPFIQFGLIAAFIGLGYFGFSSARRSEQNRVWVGMAKETAHQLGTPISAIIAWIEHLKALHLQDEQSQEVLGEFRKDVTRLELIADRFSKIGSDPDLKKQNIYEILSRVFEYMKRRAPRKVTFEYPRSEFPIMVNVNEHLFEWVIENLLRNALDSMDGEGTITGSIEENEKDVQILISDTGKGIASSKFKTVFEPGYTTKKRGWGLGLSLAKRIIESYHSGRIFVKSSVANQGTIFSIKLPKA
ncbi:MAG: HAMP domain-containing histidine kinase [Bacteroidia bacterium]|nr:HAMP domain-containing histidine kinase [Bacteroidia bacterium]